MEKRQFLLSWETNIIMIVMFFSVTLVRAQGKSLQPRETRTNFGPTTDQSLNEVYNSVYTRADGTVFSLWLENPLNYAYADLKPPVKTPKPNGDCLGRVRAAAGPSILSKDLGDEREALFGGHVAIDYVVNPNISVGVEASTYSKKVGMTTIKSSFVLIDGEYVIGKGYDDCQKNFFPDVRVLVGFGSERYGTSKGSGAVYGGGLGGVVRITPKLGVKGLVDVLFAKYDDETTTNFRASIQATYTFQ